MSLPQPWPTVPFCRLFLFCSLHFLLPFLLLIFPFCCFSFSSPSLWSFLVPHSSSCDSSIPQFHLSPSLWTHSWEMHPPSLSKKSSFPGLHVLLWWPVTVSYKLSVPYFLGLGPLRAPWKPVRAKGHVGLPWHLASTQEGPK